MKRIVLSDLDRFVPAEALSDRLEKHKWRAVPYETAEFSGVMLFANTGADAPELTFDPGLSGWHTVKLGLWNPPETPHDCQTRVRLSGDGAWTRVSGDGSSNWRKCFIESFWKHTDMTGQTVRIAQPTNIESKVSSAIAYLIFEPLSEEQVESIQADRARTDTKRLIGTHDMHYLTYIKREPDMDDFLEELEPYRYTDFETLHFEYHYGGENGEFADINHAYDAPESSILFAGDALHAHNRCFFRESGALPEYRRMVEYTHEMGKKMYLGFRMNSFASDPPYDNVCYTRFYDDNPNGTARMPTVAKSPV